MAKAKTIHPFPKKIRIAGFDYDLHVTDDKIKIKASECKSMEEGEEDVEITLMGCINDNDQIIRLSTDYHPQQQLSTLLHEIVHGIISINHIPVPEDHNTLELIVDGIANGLFLLFRDNPELLKLYTNIK